MRKTNICLTGPPGCGKSTLARALAHDLDLAYVSSGDIARELAKEDPTTRLALQQGAMAPEQAMRAMTLQRVEAAALEEGGWVLDGFPRSIAQLVCMHQWNLMPLYVEIELPILHCIERLTRRARPDDNPDSIARRFETFEQLTIPVIYALQHAGRIRSLNYENMNPTEAVDLIKTWLL